MSALLTMKRCREQDSPQADPMAMGCSPHRYQLESPASKRTRQHAEAVVAATSSSAFMASAEAGCSSAPTDFSSTLRQRAGPLAGETLFTMDQVKDIVRRAVDEKERALREQYDRILATKLQEQYMAFAKFNEDYISRSLKSNDLGYVS